VSSPAVGWAKGKTELVGAILRGGRRVKQAVSVRSWLGLFPGREGRQVQKDYFMALGRGNSRLLCSFNCLMPSSRNLSSVLS
jgi:hypothetical protein